MQDTKNLRSKRIATAMRSLPRDHFIEMSDPSLVLGRSIPPSNAVSEILELADVQPDHKVLQVGTGAGYLAAGEGQSGATGTTSSRRCAARSRAGRK